MRTRSLAVLLLVLAACSGSSVEGDVLMTSSQKFAPADLELVVGEKVTFANDSKEAHTVTAYEEDLPEGAAFFASGGTEDEQTARENVGEGLIGPGETFEVTFDQAGTYRYFCIPHESVGMVGTIVVTEP